MNKKTLIATLLLISSFGFAQTSESEQNATVESQPRRIEIGVKSEYRLGTYENAKGLTLNYYLDKNTYIPVSVIMSPLMQQYYTGYGKELEIKKNRLYLNIEAAISYALYKQGFFPQHLNDPKYKNDLTLLINTQLNLKLGKRTTFDVHLNTDMVGAILMESESDYAKIKWDKAQETVGFGLKINIGK